MRSMWLLDTLLRFTLTSSLAGMTLFAVIPHVEAEEVCTENAGPTDALGLFKPGKPLALEAGFSDPPPISRIWCWWQCHGSAFTKQELTHQLEQFAEQGFGGVEIKDTVLQPRDERTESIKDIPFMSSEWLDMFAHAERECKRLNLILRSRFGSGWNAGGPWVSPEDSSQVLTKAEIPLAQDTHQYTGPIPTKGERPSLKELRDGNAFVIAVRKDSPETIDLTTEVTDSREISWSVPAGQWALYSFFRVPSGKQLMSASPSGGGLHHDHLSTDGTDLHLRKFAQKFVEKFGPFDQTAFDGFGTDSWEMGNPTWTPGFRDEFQKRCGYDPAPYLPVVVAGYDLGDKGRRFLYDFWNVVSRLIIETHYQRVTGWCNSHEVAITGEAGAGPSHCIPNNLLEGLGAVSVPMGELWMEGRAYVKIPSSAAHTYGHRLVALESFTARHEPHRITPATLKPRADEAFLLGGNYLAPAVVEYSPAAAGKPGWLHSVGPHLNYQQTWWSMGRPFFDYLGRCCFLLQSGKNVADVAIYRTFRSSENFRWQAPSEDGLLNYRKDYAFDFVSDEILQRHASGKAGRMSLTSGADYSLLFVSASSVPTMPLETLEAIRQLLDEGVTVIWEGEFPGNSPSLIDYPACDRAMRETAQKVSEHPRLVRVPNFDQAAIVAQLEKNGTPAAIKPVNPSPLRYVHRRTETADLFFVVNRKAASVKTAFVFRVKGRTPEFWDPMTGQIAAAPHEDTPDGVKVPMEMTSLQSIFVVFREKPTEEVATAGSRRGVPSDIQTLSGPWDVTFPADSGAPEQISLEKLQPLQTHCEPGVRGFSGIATYTKQFSCDLSQIDPSQQVILDLGQVCDLCQVTLNGKDLGIRWFTPFRYDVTGVLKNGENQLTVRVANSWHNRIVSDSKLPSKDRVTRIAEASVYESPYIKNKPLSPSGLIGPVKLRVAK